MEDWQQRNRVQFERSTALWDAENARIPRHAGTQRRNTRGRTLRGLSSALAGQAIKLTAEMDRMLQTDHFQYFQQGQMAAVDQEELVYKIPRLTAEIQCMRLHIGRDGEPIKYVLREVQGNSNVGRAPDDWVFTIGPVHPNCYCVLQRELQKASPGPNDTLRDARGGAVQRQREQLQRRDERMAKIEQQRLKNLEKKAFSASAVVAYLSECCESVLPFVKSLL